MKKIVIAAGSLFSVSAVAALIPGEFQINGFLAVTSSITDVEYLASGVEPFYIGFITRRPTFDRDNNVGLQFTKALREDLSITTQFLAQGVKNWDVEANWAFIKYEPNDNWQFRAGRVRTSPFMLSEYLDVAYAYPWVRPPVEVYTQIPETYSNFTGLDVRFKFPICDRDFAITAFYGANFNTFTIPINQDVSIFDTLRVRVGDIWSFSAKYGDEVFSIRAGYEVAQLTLVPNGGTLMQELNSFLNIFSPIIGNDYINYFDIYHNTFSLMGIGYQFDWKNVVSMAELVKRHAATPVIADAIGWYVMGGYRFKQFLPHITFGRERLDDNRCRRFTSFINNQFMTFFNSPVPLNTVAQSLVYTNEFFDGGAGSQSSLTLGLRWDVYEGVAIKAEYQRVHPELTTPGLFDVNPGKNINVYSFAIDAVM